MSLEELVSVLAHDYNKSFDHAFRQKMRLEIISKRASLIRRDYDKSRPVNNSLVNLIKNLEVVEVDNPNCWFMTKCPVPKPIRLTDGDAIFSAGSSLINTYSMVESHELPYLSFNKYANHRSAKFFYTNGHFYTNVNKPLTVQMIAEDPTKFSEFIEGCSEGTVCDFEEDAFIPMDMVDSIKKMVAETMVMANVDKEIRPNDEEGNS
jgi:hypothetical protein